MNSNQLEHLIKSRRSVFPSMYNEEPISDQEIWKVLEMANWAPNHRNTEPWRFIVHRGVAKTRLGTYLQSYYKLHTSEENFSPSKYDKTKIKAEKSACILAIILHTDKLNRVPQWEELAAVACAVQNMWLMCTSMNIGSYWSSPKAAVEGDEFFNLGENEQCLGLFYMGKFDAVEQNVQRTSITEKVKWLEE